MFLSTFCGPVHRMQASDVLDLHLRRKKVGLEHELRFYETESSLLRLRDSNSHELNYTMEIDRHRVAVGELGFLWEKMKEEGQRLARQLVQKQTEGKAAAEQLVQARKVFSSMKNSVCALRQKVQSLRLKRQLKKGKGCSLAAEQIRLAQYKCQLEEQLRCAENQRKAMLLGLEGINSRRQTLEQASGQPQPQFSAADFKSAIFDVYNAVDEIKKAESEIARLESKSREEKDWLCAKESRKAQLEHFLSEFGHEASEIKAVLLKEEELKQKLSQRQQTLSEQGQRLKREVIELSLNNQKVADDIRNSCSVVERVRELLAASGTCAVPHYF